MSEKLPVRLPERIFLRRVDVNDLDWDGAEGDVHCLYSPKTIIATHMDAFIPEARHKELMERAVGEAYQRGKRDAYKQANEYTDRCYAGLIAAEAEAEEMLEAARAASSTGAGEEKV